jgi:16S rRNA G1207 methylase RsmC
MLLHLGSLATHLKYGMALDFGCGVGRLTQGMLDLVDQRRELHNRSSESEAVRAAQLEQIAQLTQSLQQSEVDRAAQLEVIHEQERQIDEL